MRFYFHQSQIMVISGAYTLNQRYLAAPTVEIDMSGIKDANIAELREAQRKLIEGYCGLVIAKKIPAVNHYEEFVEDMSRYAGRLMRSGELPQFLQLPGDAPMVDAFRKAMKALGIKPVPGSIPRRGEMLRERDVM